VITNGNWGACQWTISESGDLTIYEGKADTIAAEAMSPWYDHCGSINSVTIEGRVHFDEGASLSCMFKDCSNMKSADLSQLDTTGVTSMTSMFEGCESLTELDVSNMDFSRVNSISGMFNSCSSLKSIDFTGADTGNLVSMIGTFMNCKSLEEIELSHLDTSRVVDMSWLFCGCENLKKADLSFLDTSNVVDMSCMFLSCSQLEHVDLGDLDTSSVMDMSRMFMYCRNLRCLNVSNLDNSRTDQAEDMFLGCDRLCSLDTGDRFTFIGSGNAQVILPESGRGEDDESDWRKSTEGVYYKPGSRYFVRFDGGGAEGEMAEVTCLAADTYVIPLPAYATPEGKVFSHWNTRFDGSGTSYSPGNRVDIYADMELFAIWAGAPRIREEHEIPALVHGQTADWDWPETERVGADISEFVAQIKRPGSDKWCELTKEDSIAAEDDGSMLRYKVANFVGATYTDPVKLKVSKADYDMSSVRWIKPADLSYDGEEKRVFLEGLPDGVVAAYTGNTGTEVGDYMASAVLSYDNEHYNEPPFIKPLSWSIGRGHYNMDAIGWNYMEAFEYDGTQKQVRLEGLPEGTTPYYDGAEGVDAGTYTATVGLDYDIEHYDRPEGIAPCTWEIKKTTHDMSGTRWSEENTFVYDGGEKKVELTGLPIGVTAQYTGNQASEAGQYTARAAFVVDDPKNFCIPDPVSFEWEIKKADHDLSEMKWSLDHFEYDGTEKEIHLENVPEGVEVSYEGTTGKMAGAYLARAEFLVEDLKNYNPISPWTQSWQIARSSYDMSRVRWNYSSPYVYNGTEKSVHLKGLPEGVAATYENAAAIDAGEYTAKAILDFDRNNYDEPEAPPCTWEIKKASPDTSGICWEYEGPYTYNGESQGVYLANVPDRFTVEYEGNTAVDAGTYVAVAQLRSMDSVNYRDPEPMEITWRIDRAAFELPDIHWDSKSIKTFDGGEKSVQITDLPEGVKAVYSGNRATDAGKYTARAEFVVDDDVNFIAPDPVEIEWDIDRALMDISEIRWNTVTDFTYDGTEKRIALTGVPEGVEVRYEGASATDAGEYSARAELIPPEGSNFRNTRILNQLWRINKATIDVSGAHWNDPGQLIYDGQEKFVSVGNLPSSVRPLYEGDRHTKAGEYTASVKLIPVYQQNYMAPEFEDFTWRIEKAQVDVDDAVWSDSEELIYDGQARTVRIENLPEMIKASYTGNEATDAGQYVATATFESLDERNYIAPASIQHSWVISKADIDISDMHWAEEREFPYSGEERSITLENVPDSIEVTYKGNAATDAGQYMASAELGPVDAKNYNVPTIDPVAWEITKADLDITGVSWVSAEKLVYDGSLKVVGLTGLPEEVDVEYENNTAVDAGTYHASAVLSINSTNFKAPPIRGCTWTIAKAEVDMSDVSWSYALDFLYDGYEKHVELMDLPAGVKAEYTGNEAIEAGTYMAQAKLTVEDPNYEAPAVEPLEWKILKSDYDFSRTHWVGTTGQVYDGTAKEVVLEDLPDGLEPIYEGNVAVDAGTYEARVRFLYDEDNYEQPEEMSVTWTIEKAPLDLSGAGWDYEGPFKPSRKMRTVQLLTADGKGGSGLFGRRKEGNYLGLPEGTRVRYEGNTAKSPGTYEARAYLDIPEQPNHEVKEPLILTWEIVNE